MREPTHLDVLNNCKTDEEVAECQTSRLNEMLANYGKGRFLEPHEVSTYEHNITLPKDTRTPAERTKDHLNQYSYKPDKKDNEELTEQEERVMQAVIRNLHSGAPYETI